MPLDVLKSAEIINALEIFLDRRRPPEHLRDQVDLNYRIENQSVFIFEVRPHWMKKGQIIESSIAKTTWVNTKQHWKVFWMRGDLKWHKYEPQSEVSTIDRFLDLVDEDPHGCFWG